MGERKLYKTKLCVLFQQRGRCPRQSCSFAHGNAELRRFSDDSVPGFSISYQKGICWLLYLYGAYGIVSQHLGLSYCILKQQCMTDQNLFLWTYPYSLYILVCQLDEPYECSILVNPHLYIPREYVRCYGRRDFRGRDLREKLDRRRSPVGRYTADRDARERNASHGHSPTESVGRRSDRKRRMEHQSDGQSDISGNLNMSDGTGDHVKDKRYLSSNSRDVLQQRQLQSEIDMLDEQKQDLESYLEETTRQADSLALKNQELEIEISKEKDECKRITSKIKKFLEAYSNHSLLEDELKRSEAQLQKLASKLSSDLVRIGENGEDSAISVSDEGMAGNHFNTLDEQQKNTSPNKKRPRIHREAGETSNEVSTKGRGNASRRIAYPTQLNNEKKDRAEFNRENGYKTLLGEEKSKKRNFSSDMIFANKPKASDNAVVLPSTSMAAHAADEDVEVVETEENLEVAANATRRAGKGTPSGIPEYPFLPPPPPLPQGAYLQKYKCDDEDLLDEEAVEVDIV